MFADSRLLLKTLHHPTFKQLGTDPLVLLTLRLNCTTNLLSSRSVSSMMEDLSGKVAVIREKVRQNSLNNVKERHPMAPITNLKMCQSN